MTSTPDFSVQGGLEVSHLTAITHAVDDQKNRQQQQEKRRRRKKPPPPEPEPEPEPEIVDEVPPVGDDEHDDAEKPTVDYLA